MGIFYVLAIFISQVSPPPLFSRNVCCIPFLLLLLCSPPPLDSHITNTGAVWIYLPLGNPPPFSKGALGAISQPMKKVFALVYKYIEG